VTDRVLPLHANVHRMVDALLPWYVNETLDREERELVAHHLDECAQCRHEVEWLRGLHAACIACAEQDEHSEVFDVLRRPRKASRGSAAAWRFAAAAQLAVIAVLGWKLWTTDDTSAQYRTLAGQGAILTGNVVVVFDATAPEGEMRRLLQSVGARIVGGPTAANGYVLAIPADSQARGIEQLRASKIVRLAETLGKRETP